MGDTDRNSVNISEQSEHHAPVTTVENTAENNQEPITTQANETSKPLDPNFTLLNKPTTTSGLFHTSGKNNLDWDYGELAMPHLESLDITDNKPFKIFGGKKPQEYTHGEDIHDFLLAFDNYCRVINLPPSQAFTVFCTFLDNKSLSRVMSLHLTDRQKANWPAIKELIIKKLDPNYSSDMSVDELFNIKQESAESTLDYADRLEKMINIIPSCKTMPDHFRNKLLKDAFVNGLRSEKVVYSLLTTTGMETFADVVEQSCKLEKILGKLKTRPIDGDNLPESATLLNIQEKDNQQPTQPQQPVRILQRPKEQRTCYLCKKVGHLRKDCRVAKNCSYCKMKNHWTHECFKKNRDENSRRNQNWQRGGMRNNSPWKKPVPNSFSRQANSFTPVQNHYRFDRADTPYRQSDTRRPHSPGVNEQANRGENSIPNNWRQNSRPNQRQVMFQSRPQVNTIVQEENDAIENIGNYSPYIDVSQLLLSDEDESPQPENY